MYTRFLEESAYRRPGTTYKVTPTSTKFSQNNPNDPRNFGVFENRPGENPLLINTSVNANDPKVSGVFENKTPEKPKTLLEVFEVPLFLT